jgi:hypothetical protein
MSFSAIGLTGTSNQIILNQGASHTATISAPTPAGNNTLTLQDNSQSCDLMQGVRRVVALPATGTTNITASQSGCVFSLQQATGNTTINLPAPFLGAWYKFIVIATADGTHTQTISSTGANSNGLILSTPGGVLMTLQSSKTNWILSATAANVKASDWIEFYSADGSTYNVFAVSGGTAVGWSTS